MAAGGFAFDENRRLARVDAWNFGFGGEPGGPVIEGLRGGAEKEVASVEEEEVAEGGGDVSAVCLWE